MDLVRWALSWAADKDISVNEEGLRGAIEAYGWPSNDVGKRKVEHWLTLAADALAPSEPVPIEKRLRKPRGATRRERGQVTRAEWMRARAAVRALIRLASLDPQVIAYRARYLSGGSMEVDAASAHFSTLSDEARKRAGADLDKLCRHLSERFGWSEHQAGAVAITGEGFPPTSPLAVRVETECDSPDYTAARIVIEAQCWISPETISSAYRAAQRSAGRRGNHPLTEKALAQFDYADQALSRGAKWRQIRERLGLKSRVDILIRDVMERTGPELLRPTLSLPGARKRKRRK